MPECAGQVIFLNRNHIANRSVFDALHCFAHSIIVAPAKPRNDAEVFLASLLAGFQHATNPGAVDRDRFFAKHMFAGSDGCFEMLGAKNGVAIDRVFAVASRLSLLNPDDAEELAGN